MRVHDCPCCNCDPHERCGECGALYLPDYGHGPSQGFCSHDCEYAWSRAYRQREWERLSAERAARIDAHRPVCSATTAQGRLCNSPPMLGAHLCNNHAGAELKTARLIGQTVAEMAVDDDLAAQLLVGLPYADVADLYRRREILRQQADAVASIAG